MVIYPHRKMWLVFMCDETSILSMSIVKVNKVDKVIFCINFTLDHFMVNWCNFTIIVSGKNSRILK